MADNFFGFDTEFPTRMNVLGKLGLDEELLTDNVEEEYDALNDETFGHANDDDWETAHEKLAVLIKSTNVEARSVFNDSLLEADESQNEIVSKSISQLGMEDDLDDPAIMTISKNYHSSSRLATPFGPSPPPPAILESEICGSPKTHSIWSTTPKDSGIASFLKSISHSSDNFPYKDSPVPLNSSFDNVFTSPPPKPRALRVEELEKDLLSSSSKPLQTSSKDWPHVPVPHLKTNHSDIPNKSPSLHFPNVNNNLNKLSQEKMLTREEVEQRMLSDSRMRFPPKAAHPFVFGPNTMLPTKPNNLPSPLPPHVLHVPPPIGPPLLGNNVPVPERIHPFQEELRRRYLENFMSQNCQPMSAHFNPANAKMVQPLLRNMRGYNLPPHPLMHKQFQFPFPQNNKQYENHHPQFENEYSHNSLDVEDEYAGLMTQKEKEWLIRIQIMLLKSDNPYVEDYYFTTQVARRCRKKFLESGLKGGGDAPELILPEMSKHDKTYVPTQFAGSLGKLQAVSVNFPRKVLDITVARSLEEEDSKTVPSLSLMRRHRRLLFDIEKIYNHFLKIEDEERKILAKPDCKEAGHRSEILSLKEKVFTGFFNDSSSDENFQNILAIRKGRNLFMRALEVFSLEQQVHCLSALFRNLPAVLKRDQNDLVFVQHCSTVVDVVNRCELGYLVKLSEALWKGNDASELHSSTKDKNSFVAVLKNKFGSSVICSLLTRSEALYCFNENVESDLQSRWAKIVLHLADTLCELTNYTIAPPAVPCKNLVRHFQRFDITKEKIEKLKEILLVFEIDMNNKENISNV
ncbi:protein PAT1 homolog 1-like [Uloborus diversus]|uniref:protein PAT1 homolog 1-like n=1 Tax=Uloborus diversus TaxID=327109 RepID=UPI00240A4E05|nr:protein PAT1 homolog 1-like [Uloborus diversus]